MNLMLREDKINFIESEPSIDSGQGAGYWVSLFLFSIPHSFPKNNSFLQAIFRQIMYLSGFEFHCGFHPTIQENQIQLYFTNLNRVNTYGVAYCPAQFCTNIWPMRRT